MNADSIGIVIVNWNTGKLLRGCLESLLSSENQSSVLHIVVVDNASTDNSVELAQTVLKPRADTSKVSFIELTENLGFATANNLGIALLKERTTPLPHILFLNPDTVVEPGALMHLTQVLEKYRQAGIVGPKLLNPDGTLQPSVRNLPSLSDLLILLLKLPRLWPKTGHWRQYLQLDFNYSLEQPVQQVMGAAFLVRDTVLTTLPTWDENYFVWFEEVDYCARVLAAGWEVWYTPTATIQHYGGVSFNQLIGWARVGPWISSLRTYARQHVGILATMTITVLSPLAVVLSLPASLRHMMMKRHNQANL